MAVCLYHIFHFLMIPPALSTLDNLASDQSHFRFWSLLNEVGYGRTGKLFRPLWRMFPRILVYRAVVIPVLAFSLFRASWRAANTRHGERLCLPATELFFKILTAILKQPGLMPDDYFIYALHLPTNAPFAETAAHNIQIRFLADLATMNRPGSARFSEIANDKLRFHSLVSQSGLPAAPILVVFDTKATWLGERQLPREDLFLKPKLGSLSIGAAVVSFNGVTDSYRICEMAEPFPAWMNFPGYPTESMTSAELIAALTELGKIVPLVLQPKLICHPFFEKLTGSSQLVTVRVICARAIGSRSVVLGAYLRMAADGCGSDAFAAGGIAVSLDRETGQMLCAKKKYEDEELQFHPLTGEVFSGLRVPFVKESLEACRTVHQAIAATDEFLVPVVGFDVAIVKDGYWFMEANCPCDLQFQKLGVPYGSDKAFIDCVRSHLSVLPRGSQISVDPLLRKRQLPPTTAS